MTIPHRPLAWVESALALVVFLVFLVLSVRHVGDSVFLSDQADQLQFFERFLRLDPTGLWGPIMSSPDPPTRSLGPLGGWLFGIPVGLGLGIDAVQAVTSVALVVTILVAFAALVRVDRRVAWAWLIVMLANPILWWNAGMLWANTLLLPMGSLLVAAMVVALQRPGLASLGAMLLVALFAMHISLVAITALPPAAVVLLRTWREAWRHPPRRAIALALGVAIVAAIGPYLLAEAMTGFENTAAVLAQATKERTAEASATAGIVLPVLLRAADPTGIVQRVGASGWIVVAIGLSIATVALVIWWRHARGQAVAAGLQAREGVVFWLVLASIVGIAGQAAFFVAERRELLSYHYIAMLVPLYAIPPAALVAWVAARIAESVRLQTDTPWGGERTRDVAATALGALCLLLIVWRGPDLADRYWEHTNWTYTRIAGAVNALCGPGGSARTVEGSGFDSLMPGHDGVVKYLMTRGFLECRYDEQSDAIIAASRDGNYEPMRQESDGVYELADVVDPGIALYRRARP